MSDIQALSQLSDAFQRDMERLDKAKTYGRVGAAALPWGDHPRLCPCCGDGFPVCADFETLSRPLAHRLTCQQYRFNSETCQTCTLEDPS